MHENVVSLKPADLFWKEDLQWWDGPTLSLFEELKGTLYLLHWVDVNRTSTFFLMARSNTGNIEAFTRGETDLKSLLLAEGAFWFVEVAGGTICYLRPLEREQIPEDWLPDEGCFFEEDLRPSPTS